MPAPREVAVKAEDLLGRTFAGKYSLESLLGKGGFGAVYRATHHPIGRTVAVKVSLQRHRDDLHARFVREAQVQANLRHPSCVMLLDFGQEPDGLFYMVQEFVDGQSLTERLRDRGPFSPPRAVAITRAVLGALHEAHRLGIVHRDIKPANVMLTRGLDDGEEVRVLDFGIAKVLHGEAVDAALTNTGATLGTPSFMAPEQIRQGPIGPATDIYAVGAMLYRLCAGTGPFTAAVTFDILRMHLDTPPPPLPFPAPGLDAVIARAMAKEPADRYGSAREMIAALDALDAPRPRSVPIPRPTIPPADGDTTNANGERLVEPTPSRERRGGWLWVAGLVALGALIGLGWQWLGADRPSDRGPMTLAASGQGAPAVDIRRATPPDASLTFEVGVPVTTPDTGAPEPDATIADAAPPDVAPPAPAPTRVVRPVRRAPKPAKPPPPSPDAIAKAFASELKACRCSGAKRQLDRLARVDAARAKPLRYDYEDECKARLPGNCLDKASR